MSWTESLFWISGGLILYTYIGYPVFLFILSFFKSPHRTKDPNNLPPVSMLIAAYNEEVILEEKLRNCLSLNYPREKLEIIIGSDGSNDRTNEIVQQYEEQGIRLISYPIRRGKAAVLNNIVQMAQGEILVFSDANTIYSPDALMLLVQHFGDTWVGGVCGRLVLLNQAGKSENRGEQIYWGYENYLKYLEGKIKTVVGANGAVYAIRKKYFKPLPCDKAIMDDFLIPLSIVQQGYDVVYDRDAVAYEFVAPNMKSEFKRKARIGAANFHGIREILPLLNPTRGFIAIGLWSHKIIRWIVPFLLITIFMANIYILELAPLYKALFAIQVFLYGLGFIAWILDRLNIPLPLLGYPYYFVVVNLALLAGFVKFLTRSQKPVWARVDR